VEAPMKCDTKASNSDQCAHCLLEFVQSDDDELWMLPCKADGCGVRHLRKNMIEKVEGHYCESCAASYEQDLLDKMTRKEEVA
jgi:hypothetical protein